LKTADSIAVTPATGREQPVGHEQVRRSGRLPGLDGLRAIAVIGVLLYHAGVRWIPGGFLGVDLFFVISGFLITSLLLATADGLGRISLRRFYARRARRLLPALAVMVAVVVGFMAVFFRGDLGQARGDVAAATGYFSNWWYLLHHRSYFVAAGRPSPFQHLWSLAVEEQFYLVWPWVVKYLSPGGLLGIASLLLAAAYLTLALLLGQKQTLDPAIWVNSLVQFQFFALGAMTAVGLGGRVPNLSKRLRWGLFSAGLLCLRTAQAAAFTSDPSVAHDFANIAPRFLIALAACLCLFFSLLPLDGGRMQKPFIYLGKISYGLYVYHVLCLGAAKHLSEHFAGNLSPGATQLWTMAIALPFTIVTSMLSYRYLETPFLRLKKRFTVVRSRPV
jgi:peptidoglycan/LPS O-acetylase OafA/YrhL